MSRQHRQIKGWDEQDVFTSWRHLLCYLTKPGAKAYTKRKARRRERREGKTDMQRRFLE
jgi:hypothetical protein